MRLCIHPDFPQSAAQGHPGQHSGHFYACHAGHQPVVLFSTYVAFTGNWRVVACRAGLGIVCAVLVGLTFCRTPVSAAGSGLALSGVLCTCGSGGQAAEGWRGALLGYLRHTQTEFFTVGKYLTAGAFVSASCKA